MCHVIRGVLTHNSSSWSHKMQDNDICDCCNTSPFVLLCHILSQLQARMTRQSLACHIGSPSLNQLVHNCTGEIKLHEQTPLHVISRHPQQHELMCCTRGYVHHRFASTKGTEAYGTARCQQLAHTHTHECKWDQCRLHCARPKS